MAKLSIVKRSGGSSSYVTKWSESVPSEKLTSNVPIDNSVGPAYGIQHEHSSIVGTHNVSSSAFACVALEVNVGSIGCMVASYSTDEHPTGRVNIGGGRTRANRRRIPKKVQKLLQNEDLSTEKLVHKSVAVENAVELIKLVFLNSSADTEVPKVLVDTL